MHKSLSPMKGRCSGSQLGWLLVIIGAINWGLVGLGYFAQSNWNVIYWIFGKWPALENLVYVIVGLSGVYLLVGCRCKICKGMLQMTEEKPQA